MTSLDQEATGESAEESEAGGDIVAMLRKSLEASVVKIESPAQLEPKAPKDLSEKQRLTEQLQVAYVHDLEKGYVTEPWVGSSFQIMSWHYGKNLGRYFPDQT